MNLEVLKRILIDSVSPEIKEKFLDGKLSRKEERDILLSNVPDSVGYGHVITENGETMIGLARLNNFHFCISKVIEDEIEGDIIEAGVWKGGACILARAICKENKSNKKVYVADSFEGLPKPDGKYPADNGDPHHTMKFLNIDLDTVKENFKKYGLLDDKVVFIKGFFKDSLKEVPFKKLSVLRLDGDMYGSTWEALDYLYHKLSIGGYLIIDDFFLPACIKAVNDFRSFHSIKEPIMSIDWTGVYWRKECHI